MSSKADALIVRVECFLRRTVFTRVFKLFIENSGCQKKILYSGSLLITILTGMLPTTVMLESNTCQVSSDTIIKVLLVQKFLHVFFLKYFESL